MSQTIQKIPLQTIDGHQTTLENYTDKVLLLVNVASKCGLTPQYEGLEKLYQQYKAQGLEILAFPSNDFLAQEPGTNEEIQQFCSLNYQVSFPLFAKIPVVGPDKHALYRELIAAQPSRIGEGPWVKDLVEYGLTPNEPPEILWNFEKFLLNKQGDVVARFAPDITADDSRLVEQIKQLLNT